MRCSLRSTLLPSSEPPALIVLAKAPSTGRAKTRLCPPCSASEAAALAEAALLDTLAAVSATPASRHVLVLDGPAGPWLPPGFAVVHQRGDGLAARLDAAFIDVGSPSLLIGMDTPQLTPELLGHCTDRMADDFVDAVLGPAADGGFWAIGLRRRCDGVFAGVPMSTGATGSMQRARLVACGLRVAMLPMLRDVDVIDDAVSVAHQAPDTRFARLVETLRQVGDDDTRDHSLNCCAPMAHKAS